MNEGLPSGARDAARRRDWDAALRLWDDLRIATPGRLDAWAGAIAALRRLERLQEAGRLLADAQARFGDRPALSIEAARLAEANGDRAEAARLWDHVHRTAPERPAPAATLARLLRLEGRVGEALAVVTDAQARFPAHAPLLAERARCLEAIGDTQAAAARWREAWQLPPQDPKAAAQAVRLLAAQDREAEAAALLTEARARFPQDPDLLVAAARLAARQDRPGDAIALWDAARAARPHHPAAYHEAAPLLRRAGRPEDAEALLAEGVRRFPDHAGIALRHAELLLALHRLVEAHARYADLRHRFPANPATHIGAARALVAAGERAAADTLLAEARTALPADAAVAVEHALLPLTRTFQSPQQRDEALRRLSAVVAAFPHHAPAHAHLIRVLGVAGRHEDAQQRAEAAMALLPSAASPAIAAAGLALDHHPPERALATARAVAARFPADPRACALLAEAMALNGDHDGAEDLLRSARDDTPPSLEIEMAYATLPQRRGDWVEAAQRWAAARRQFPGAPYLASRHHDARLAAIDAGQADQPESEADEGLAGLMGRFESLGGRPYGCELGFAQRAFNAHPLGLLRWTRSDPTMVAAAMEARFAGVASPGQIALRVLKAGAGEYMAHDRRYGFITHTFVRRRDVDEAAMLRQMCMRQRYLSERLLRQLAEGERIFVYKNTRLSTPEADLDRLHRAFRALSPGTLLLVRRATSERMNGTVERAGPGLLVGYLTQFHQAADGWRSGPALAAWRRLCTDAARLATPD